MSDFHVNEQDQKKAERIRRQYIHREDNKIEQLQRLDDKVKAHGKAVACILGVAGALVMGAGMSLVMVWENMSMGLVLGIPGLIAVLIVYPVYQLITGSRKKKYANEIMRLSEAVVNR